MKTRKLSNHATPIVLAFLVIAFGACGASTVQRVATLDAVPECEAYVDQFERCLRSMGTTPELADRHAAGTRKALISLAESDREAARSRCESAIHQLSASCGIVAKSR